MYFKNIVKVEFHKLNYNIDRRGPIATFHGRDVPNKEYILLTMAQVIRNIIGFLDSNYEMNDISFNIENFLGEHQECWLFKHHHDQLALVLTHKYWMPAQLDLFYNLIELLARQYKWEIIDGRKANSK